MGTDNDISLKYLHTPEDERLEPENTGPRKEEENHRLQTIMTSGSIR